MRGWPLLGASLLLAWDSPPLMRPAVPAAAAPLAVASGAPGAAAARRPLTGRRRQQRRRRRGPGRCGWWLPRAAEGDRVGGPSSSRRGGPPCWPWPGGPRGSKTSICCRSTAGAPRWPSMRRPTHRRRCSVPTGARGGYANVLGGVGARAGGGGGPAGAAGGVRGGRGAGRQGAAGGLGARGRNRGRASTRRGAAPRGRGTVARGAARGGAGGGPAPGHLTEPMRGGPVPANPGDPQRRLGDMDAAECWNTEEEGRSLARRPSEVGRDGQDRHLSLDAHQRRRRMSRHRARRGRGGAVSLGGGQRGRHLGPHRAHRRLPGGARRGRR